MTIPPHIANAPTPRTNKEIWQNPETGMEYVESDDMRQLEREQLYMMGVIEEQNETIETLIKLASNSPSTSPLLFGKMVIKADQSFTAYAELKKYMEEKK